MKVLKIIRNVVVTFFMVVAWPFIKLGEFCKDMYHEIDMYFFRKEYLCDPIIGPDDYEE